MSMGTSIKTCCNGSNKKCKKNQEMGKLSLSEEVFSKLPPTTNYQLLFWGKGTEYSTTTKTANTLQKPLNTIARIIEQENRKKNRKK